jgi:Na+/proline symporter
LEDPDKAVPKLVRELLPPGLRGLVFEAFFAALMSSVDSYLNSATTIIISDGYRPVSRALMGVDPGDRELLILSRVLTGLLIVTAGFLAPFIDQFETIYTAMQTLFSLFQGPTLAVLVLGVFWRRANAWGGFAGLLLGVLCSGSLSLVGESLFPSEDPFLYVAFWAFIFSLIVTVIVSMITPAPTMNQIRGLVFGEVIRDKATQTLIKKRIESE